MTQQQNQGIFDPFLFSQSELVKVKEGLLRKYYRFRPARFYGGIATADCVGCNLRCAFCWSQKQVWRTKGGQQRFFLPEQVVNKLISIAEKKNFKYLRISGGEPTLHFEHLLHVLELIPTASRFRFILETNGLLLAKEEYVEQLTKFPFLRIRLSLKAGPRLFPQVTRSILAGYEAQIQAINNLKKHQLRFHIAIVKDFFDPAEIQVLYDRGISVDEVEELILYPFVIKSLQHRHLIT